MKHLAHFAYLALLLTCSCGPATARIGSATMRIENTFSDRHLSGLFLSSADAILLGVMGDNQLDAPLAAGDALDLTDLAAGSYNALALFDDGRFAYFEAFAVGETPALSWSVQEVGVARCGFVRVQEPRSVQALQVKVAQAEDWGPNLLGGEVVAGQSFYVIASAQRCDVRIAYSDGSARIAHVAVFEDAVVELPVD